MKPRFRQSMGWLHTWAGFAFAWLLFFIFVTGSAGYFENEIDRWMMPEIAVVNKPIDDFSVLTSAEQQLDTLAADATQWYISYPTGRDPYIGISWLQPANAELGTARQWHKKFLSPDTGNTITARKTSGGETLYRLHYNLHYVPVLIGYLVTSLATLFMLIGLVTGVIIHKKIFIEFFTFRKGKGLRSWLDIHNVFSVLPLPFHLMITYSGLILLMGVSFFPVIDNTYGVSKKMHRQFYDESQVEDKQQQIIDLNTTELSLKAILTDAKARYENQNVSYLGLIDRNTEQPGFEVWFEGDEGLEFATLMTYRMVNGQVQLEKSLGKAHSAAKVYDILEHLHEGLFADIYLRWLYFISGLLGAAMIASGMIIWVKKRQKQQTIFINLIDRLNAAVIVGLPIAIAGYFWSNRLLPLAMVNRAAWEVHSLFIVFAACICFCAVSSTDKVWKSMLWIAAIAYALLPLGNILTTEHSLLASAQNSDWLMLGFDLIMLLFAACFALAAALIKNKDNKTVQA
ncbi:PepSY-associated TM helix domain-containing protein [Cognaticolwellia aestuarii]|uniref:PepSY-associated TM helix domain-containing protein n=1 Tax=Cognaticolwellia aestuarii TaxID=329993 RepID=UPI001F3D1767|nr:PepSY-associated TM helix domain-containing protein [Cognaticolwellia aestuarii]